MFGKFCDKLCSKVSETISVIIALIGFIFVLLLQIFFYGGFIALVILTAYFILRFFLGG